jgi:hypothetical protein
MGCDIHAHVEQRDQATGQWRKVTDLFPLDDFDRKFYGKEMGDEPFGWRNYGMFGFFADVRNYSHSPVLAPCRGVPDDASPEVRDDWEEWGVDAHSATWYSVAELLAYDYDQVIWDRRVTKGNNGAALAEEGEGTHPTMREFLGPAYFAHLRILAGLGGPQDVRVVMWFDN